MYVLLDEASVKVLVRLFMFLMLSIEHSFYSCVLDEILLSDMWFENILVHNLSFYFLGTVFLTTKYFLILSNVSFFILWVMLTAS